MWIEERLRGLEASRDESLDGSQESMRSREGIKSEMVWRATRDGRDQGSEPLTKAAFKG
jgi:hypothetical protein